MTPTGAVQDGLDLNFGNIKEWTRSTIQNMVGRALFAMVILGTALNIPMEVISKHAGFAVMAPFKWYRAPNRDPELICILSDGTEVELPSELINRVKMLDYCQQAGRLGYLILQGGLLAFRKFVAEKDMLTCDGRRYYDYTHDKSLDAKELFATVVLDRVFSTDVPAMAVSSVLSSAIALLAPNFWHADMARLSEAIETDDLTVLASISRSTDILVYRFTCAYMGFLGATLSWADALSRAAELPNKESRALFLSQIQCVGLPFVPRRGKAYTTQDKSEVRVAEVEGLAGDQQFLLRDGAVSGSQLLSLASGPGPVLVLPGVPLLERDTNRPTSTPVTLTGRMCTAADLVAMLGLLRDFDGAQDKRSREATAPGPSGETPEPKKAKLMIDKLMF